MRLRKLPMRQKKPSPMLPNPKTRLIRKMSLLMILLLMLLKNKSLTIQPFLFIHHSSMKHKINQINIANITMAKNVYTVIIAIILIHLANAFLWMKIVKSGIFILDFVHNAILAIRQIMANVPKMNSTLTHIAILMTVSSVLNVLTGII